MNYSILRLKCYIESFYIYIMSKQNKIVEHIHNILTVPCEKSKTISFAYSIMKSIVVFSFIFWLSLFFGLRFPAKLICCIAFGSILSACCFLKSIAISL